ncbi:MAG: fibronectin type III domain-containing protein [Candidatus Cloacimonetes bacterium]|nr:fibronectin type III domain-containing protein [Candidatus Cloacimonadota bacterium]
MEFFGELAATLTCSNGNWINDLSISKTNAAIVLGSGLTVKGDLMIVSGALSSSSYTINLNGMWDNQVGASGFGEGTGTVCFQGTGNRIINGNETFYNLSIDLTPGSSTPYMYSSGAVTMMNNLNIISGVVNLTMNAIWAVLGDITISYGACLNIAGVTGSPTLYAQGNITDNSSTIDATHGFYADGPCTLILNGFQEQYLNTQQSSVKLGNLSLAYYSWFYPADALIVQGDFQMSGTTCWNSSTTGLTHTFMGDFIMAGGTYWFDNTGTVTFTGSEAATISILGEANFGNAIINKTPVSRIEGPVLSLSNDLYLVGNGTLTIQSGVLDLNGHDLYTSGDILINADGKLSMDAGASLNLNSNKSMIVNDGGEFESIGLPGSNATVGSQSGYYAFRISSGGYIAAENTIFEDMNISGIYVMSGATVDELHAFNGCTFRNGEAGGVLLVINNSQFLDINDAIFPTNTWSGGFNVRKTYNTGSISFLNETGNYTSSIYEDDPYMRINWSSEIPVIEMDPVSFSFGEVGLYQQESRFFTIRNTGTGNLIGSIISTDEFLVYVSSFRSGLPTRQKPTRNDRYQVEFMVFPMDSIQVEVRFRPQLPIFYEETIIINHNAAGAPISIDVDGMGTGPVMTSSPGMINKGVLPNGTWSSTLTIGNEGNETLSYDVYAFYSGAVIMNVVSEGFENAFPPASWTETQVIGTEGDWSRITETIHPQNYTPQQGSYMAVFNSYTSHSNNRTRLETGNLNLVDITSAFMTFWMFHDTDYPSYYDRIQVQVSVNGGDWINVGTAFARYIGVLGWQQHGVSLINWDGMSNVRVGFLAISEYGNDMHIDDVYIFGVSQNPDWLSFNGVSTVNGSIDEGDPVDEISIDIDMSGLANGWYSAQIHIDSNSPINPSAWIPVEIIVGNPGMLLMPEDLAFGSCFTGTETTRVFSITSTGTIGLHGTITTPAGYSVVRTYMPMWENRESGTDDRTEPRNTLEYNLSTMETANFLVTFYPPAAGDYNGNILITEEYMADRTISVTGECFGYCIVETDTVYALGASFATVDGAVLSDGNRTILSRGICWNAFGNPTVEDDTLGVAGTMGAFSAELTGLFHNTQYYVRTYARNQIGVAYGDEIAFTTMNPTLYYSGVPLADFGGILVGELSPEASFTISGEYLVDMVMLNVLQGFEISLTSEEDRSQVREFGTQIFLYPVGETLAETNIYVRFTPEETIDYNESITILTVGGSNPDVMLTGRGIDFPSVFTDITSAVTLNSVIMHGTIISDGNDTILNSGFCWDTEGNPTLADDNVNLGFQTGAFYSIIDSLQSNTTYYYCAWAENSGGVAYGHTLSFTTSLNPHIYSSTETIDDFGEVPMEVSSEPQSFTISAQQLSSNICLSTTGAFEIFVPDARMSTRNYTNSLEITPVNNNIAETTVMVRFSPSAAGQAAGTIYLTSLDADTLEISLSGTGITLPVVVADTLTSITATSANASGHLVDNGWGTITVNGFCWGVNTEPTLADNYSEEAVAQNFSSTLTNLNPGTTYFVRAYAVNGAGINYGNELSFMTESVILDTPSNIVISIAGEDVLLNWDAVPGAGSYYLYCSTEPYPADWGYPIDITTANTYTDTGAIFGSIRFYRIIAHSESLGRR